MTSAADRRARVDGPHVAPLNARVFKAPPAADGRHRPPGVAALTEAQPALRDLVGALRGAG